MYTAKLMKHSLYAYLFIDFLFIHFNVIVFINFFVLDKFFPFFPFFCFLLFHVYVQRSLLTDCVCIVIIITIFLSHC